MRSALELRAIAETALLIEMQKNAEEGKVEAHAENELFSIDFIARLEKNGFKVILGKAVTGGIFNTYKYMGYAKVSW